jgi:hypothetical protein
MKAMDMFHTFADWKAQNVQNSITKLVHHKADYDQLRAECEKLKSEVNMRASERAQREVRKREVCVYIHSLPFHIQTGMNMQLCFSLCTVNPLNSMFYKLLSRPVLSVICYHRFCVLMYF